MSDFASILILHYKTANNHFFGIQDRRNFKTPDFDFGFFGGKNKNNENPFECLKREILEELNIKLSKKLNPIFNVFDSNFKIYVFELEICEKEKNFFNVSTEGKIIWINEDNLNLLKTTELFEKVITKFLLYKENLKKEN